MFSADRFCRFLEQRGYTFFSGVPCSILKPVIETFSRKPNMIYVPAVRESAAVGIASGAYITGKKSGILIQNSGLGNIVNALTSFNLIYKIPILMFITWRGYQGKDAPQHLIMGRKMMSLLQCLAIPTVVLTDSYKEDLDKAIQILKTQKIPTAVIIKKGLID